MSSPSSQRPLRLSMPQPLAARRWERTRTQVVCVRGDVDIDTAPHVSARLRLAIARRPHGVIADLSNTTLLDSAGVAALISARRRADQHGVPFCVVAAPGTIARRVLEIVGCLQSLAVVDDRLAAIATIDRATPAASPLRAAPPARGELAV